jgi:hypothetical protein
LPRGCDHGARHDETYFEIIDGLNKEKPMPEARSLRRFRPTADRRFAPAPERTDGDANYVYH